MATIICEDCGATRERAPRNTVTCQSCRLLRNLEFLFGRTRKCAGCAERFAPVDVNDAYCGTCHPGTVTAVGHCKFCKADNVRLIRKGIALCKSCARDPVQRPRVIQGLQSGQAARRAANNHEGTP